MADPPVVIIADPDATHRARVRKIVDDINSFVDILEAENRKELNAHIKAKKPSLIIMEVLLEGGSGFDLLRRLARKYPEDAPPVILVTDMAREIDRYWGLRGGAHAFIAKPYEDKQLRDRIAKALSGGPSQRPTPAG